MKLNNFKNYSISIELDITSSLPQPLATQDEIDTVVPSSVIATCPCPAVSPTMTASDAL